jgi:hypothetical protein
MILTNISLDGQKLALLEAQLARRDTVARNLKLSRHRDELLTSGT